MWRGIFDVARDVTGVFEDGTKISKPTLHTWSRKLKPTRKLFNQSDSGEKMTLGSSVGNLV